MYYEFVVLGWVFTMCNFKLSSGLNNMLQAMLKDSEFKKIQYYMRCLKKAPHGGVFRNTHQSAFLKYYRVQTFPFLEKDRPVPYPIELYKVNVTQMLDCYDVDMEELLGFCFGTKTNVGDVSFEEAYGGNQFFSALASGTLSLKDPIAYSFVDVLADAVEGRIKFTDYFDYDYSRLLDVFILRCVEQNLISFSKIEDVCAIEQLEDGFDKYGLSNVTTSDFERQGFTQDNQFFLYNIFFDTSIGSANAKVPQTIEILKKYVDDHISIYMRKDSALSVPTEKKVISATLDMQKWRGITLNLNDLEAQIRYGKEVTVHFDPQTMHKVIAIVKAAETDDREKYYHITVEELWSPQSICECENVVLTNFIHGCYYPARQSFDHIDFSVNQYSKDIFLKKYQDSVAMTSISIEQYSDKHYKVWCIKDGHIPLQLWAELVICTLDEPFRALFAEIIGAETVADED